MRKTQYILSFFIASIFLNLNVCAQTIIKAGEVNGVWMKKNSPYIVNGDINIGVGKSLVIQPGVKVYFKGPYVLNVQGSLLAVGSEADSIYFTIKDTLGYTANYKIGWNAIHFDSREIHWDTIKFTMPIDREAKSLVLEKLKRGLIDTTSFIKIGLRDEDFPPEENEWRVPDQSKSDSKIVFCKFEYTTVYEKSRPYIFGGAIYIYRYPGVVITNSKFVKCRAFAGGAIYCKEASPIISNCIFQNCRALSSGGAMVFIHSGTILMNNKLLNNKSGYNGGCILFYESCPLLINNIILKNTADNNGGGIYIERKTVNLNMENYEMNKKTKLVTSSFSLSKNLSSDISRIANNVNGLFINNIICKNSSKNGGGIGVYATAPQFINNTICNNYSEESGGGLYGFYSEPIITNSIIYYNETHGEGQQMFFQGKNSVAINFSLIEGFHSQISKDTSSELSISSFGIDGKAPLFKNLENLNYYLQSESPCINAGCMDTLMVKLTLTDVYGNNRIYNQKIDIGASEYNGYKQLKDTEVNNDEFITSESDESVNKNETLFNVYPNPSNGNFLLIADNVPSGEIRIIIMSRDGKLVYKESQNTLSRFEKYFNLEEYSSGTYFLQVYSGEKRIYEDKIIIK
jgi:hypothetical protein